MFNINIAAIPFQNQFKQNIKQQTPDLFLCRIIYSRFSIKKRSARSVFLYVSTL